MSAQTHTPCAQVGHVGAQGAKAKAVDKSQASWTRLLEQEVSTHVHIAGVSPRREALQKDAGQKGLCPGR